MSQIALIRQNVFANYFYNVSSIRSPERVKYQVANEYITACGERD